MILNWFGLGRPSGRTPAAGRDKADGTGKAGPENDQAARPGAPHEDALATLAAEKGVPLPVLRQIVAGLAGPPDWLRLRARVGDYSDLRDRLSRPAEDDDPRVQALRREAAAAIDAGAFGPAEANLSEAERIDLAAAGEAQDIAARRRAAASRAARALLARLRFDDRMAAAHFAEAATLAAGDAAAAWTYRQNQAGALYQLGADGGDTAALQDAIAACGEALRCVSRERTPLRWATTQNSLGDALRTLGEREAGTARLEEAVAAYRAALQERSPKRQPLAWASTQNNLGAALRTLGARTRNTARLEEAVAAWEACLGVAPTVWPEEIVRSVRSRRDRAQAEIARG